MAPRFARPPAPGTVVSLASPDSVCCSVALARGGCCRAVALVSEACGAGAGPAALALTALAVAAPAAFAALELAALAALAVFASLVPIAAPAAVAALEVGGCFESVETADTRR